MADKLVTIANFAFGPDPVSAAELARIKLEAEGIECFLAGENFIATYWLLSGADNGIKLQVRESEAKKAMEVLGHHERVNIEEKEQQDSISEEEILKCPKCGSEDIEYERFSRKMFYLSVLLFRFPVPFLKKRYRCNKCHHKWK